MKNVFGEGFQIPSLSYPAHPIPVNPATSFAANMHLGWNLGNSLDACLHSGLKEHFEGLDTEICWSNPKTTKKMLEDIRTAGFDTIRIPVSWHDHISGPDFTIDPAWMDRVEEVVNWSRELGFYIFLNTHHDINPDAIYPTPEKRENSLHFVRSVWTQIAERFRDHDDHLLFESMNEPRVAGSKYEWETDLSVEECQNAVLIINELNQAFVDVVRASGSKNQQRFLVVCEYANAVENALTELFHLPSDPTPDHILLSIHCYRPVKFAFLLKDHESTDRFDPYSEEDTNKISDLAEKVYSKFIVHGIPAVIDEFGAVFKENHQERIHYAAYHVAICRSYGITCHWWDNGYLIKAGDGMAIYDRTTNTFPDRTILEAMKAYS